MFHGLVRQIFTASTNVTGHYTTVNTRYKLTNMIPILGDKIVIGITWQEVREK
jgi:hypothetical protein